MTGLDMESPAPSSDDDVSEDELGVSAAVDALRCVVEPVVEIGEPVDIVQAPTITSCVFENTTSHIWHIGCSEDDAYATMACGRVFQLDRVVKHSSWPPQAVRCCVTCSRREVSSIA